MTINFIIYQANRCVTLGFAEKIEFFAFEMKPPGIGRVIKGDGAGGKYQDIR